ncbi:ribosome-associated protein YbcJ [Photorhabdus stackebrandtii]|uniref:Ribosome-associated protein n=1 Tax=Photorhabdus stackebrandtii TaxID=1123042 RepID=A0A7X5QMR0_9GAMM|nr:ribosome-associated protein YbcJ [Photorhabdus stackebrandtii]NHB97207.1 ribosome-associated protein [Photorhabdus stackebrandtii]
MEIFSLEGHPHVELCDLLKFQGWSESGAAAKAVIAEGLIEVNGQTETRKRCKITAGQVVTFNGDSVCIKE